MSPKATLFKMQKRCAEDMVIAFLHFAKYLNLCTVFIYCMVQFNLPISILELLTVKSVEENDFIVKYSPSVWKHKMNVWLGMFYDSDGKFHFHP